MMHISIQVYNALYCKLGRSETNFPKIIWVLNVKFNISSTNLSETEPFWWLNNGPIEMYVQSKPTWAHIMSKNKYCQFQI